MRGDSSGVTGRISVWVEEDPYGRGEGSGVFGLCSRGNDDRKDRYVDVT